MAAFVAAATASNRGAVTVAVADSGNSSGSGGRQPAAATVFDILVIVNIGSFC